MTTAATATATFAKLITLSAPVDCIQSRVQIWNPPYIKDSTDTTHDLSQKVEKRSLVFSEDVKSISYKYSLSAFKFLHSSYHNMKHHLFKYLLNNNNIIIKNICPGVEWNKLNDNLDLVKP